jgi:drug/metabolite transporter (DMT)-like permease
LNAAPKAGARIDLETLVLLTLPPLIWAGNAVIGRAARSVVGPFHLNFLRWAVAGLVLVPFVARDLRRFWPQLRPSLGWIALMGFLGVTCYNSLQYLALRTSSPINTTLIGSSGPVFTLMLGALFFHERIRALQVVGAVVSLAGVAWVIAHGDLSRLRALDLDRGDLCMLLATLGWSGYTWLVRQRRPKAPIGALLMIQIVFGLVFAAPLLLYESAAGLALPPVSWQLAAMVAYIAIFASLMAYFCWDRGVARSGALLPMFFFNLTPVFAALMASAALGEEPHGFHAVGLTLILAGIVCASLRRS